MTRATKPKRFACECDECRSGCYRRPGWMTPDEAVKLIENGHGNRLMLDLWFADEDIDHNVFLLAPAVVGSETKKAPSWINGRCTFLNESGKCDVNSLKPIECAVCGCKDKRTTQSIRNWRRDSVLLLWDNDQGRAIVQKWCDEHDLNMDYEMTLITLLEMTMGYLESASEN